MDWRCFLAVFGRLGLGCYRTGDSCAPQTTVSIRVFTQVLLVVILCVVERLGFGYFSCNQAKTFFCQHLKHAARKTQSLRIHKDELLCGNNIIRQNLQWALWESFLKQQQRTQQECVKENRTRTECMMGNKSLFDLYNAENLRTVCFYLMCPLNFGFKVKAHAVALVLLL